MIGHLSSPEEVVNHLSQIDSVRRVIHLTLARFKGIDPTNLSHHDNTYMQERLDEFEKLSPGVIRKGASKFFWRKNLSLGEQLAFDKLLAASPQLRVDNEAVIDGRFNYYGRDFIIAPENGTTLPENLTVSEISLGLLKLSNDQNDFVRFLDVHPLRHNEGIDQVTISPLPLSDLFKQTLVGLITATAPEEIAEFVKDYPRFLSKYPELEERQTAENNRQNFFPNSNLSALPLEGKFYLWRYIKSIDPALQFADPKTRDQFDEIRNLCLDWGPNTIYLFQALDGDLNLINRFMASRRKGSSTTGTHLNNDNIKKMLLDIGALELSTAEQSTLEYDHKKQDALLGSISHLKTRQRSFYKGIIASFFDPDRSTPLPTTEEWKYIFESSKRLAVIPRLTAMLRDKKLPLRKEVIPFELLDKAFDYLAEYRSTESLYDTNTLWFMLQSLINQRDLKIEDYIQWTIDFYRAISEVVYSKADQIYGQKAVEVPRYVKGYTAVVTQKDKYGLPDNPVVAAIGIGPGRDDDAFYNTVRNDPQLKPAKMYGFDIQIPPYFEFSPDEIDFRLLDVGYLGEEFRNAFHYISLTGSPLNNQALLAVQIYYLFNIAQAQANGGVLSHDTGITLKTKDLKHTFWTIEEEFHKINPHSIPGSRGVRKEYLECLDNPTDKEIGAFIYRHQWYCKLLQIFGYDLINIPPDPKDFAGLINKFSGDDHEDLVAESAANPDPMKYPIYAIKSGENITRRITYMAQKKRDLDLNALNQAVETGEIPPFIRNIVVQINELFIKKKLVSASSTDQNIT